MLTKTVGPVLFTYGVDRHRDVYTVAVPLDAEAAEATGRSAWEQTCRALNPPKVAALRRILARHARERVIVFTDTVLSAQALHATVFAGRSLLLYGRANKAERDERLRVFRRADPGALVLLCTRVCDAAIDFPARCVVVQYHLASGSRQQELQRCGRGTRDGVGDDAPCVYHLVNRGTEEETFSHRRTAHVQQTAWGVTTAHAVLDDGEVTAEDASPMHFIRVHRPPPAVPRRPPSDHGKKRPR